MLRFDFRNTLHITANTAKVIRLCFITLVKPGGNINAYLNHNCQQMFLVENLLERKTKTNFIMFLIWTMSFDDTLVDLLLVSLCYACIYICVTSLSPTFVFIADPFIDTFVWDAFNAYRHTDTHTYTQKRSELHCRIHHGIEATERPEWNKKKLKCDCECGIF